MALKLYSLQQLAQISNYGLIFSSNSSSAVTQSGEPATSILSQLGLGGNVPTEAGLPKSKLLSVGAGLPALPKKLIEQI